MINHDSVRDFILQIIVPFKDTCSALMILQFYYLQALKKRKITLDKDIKNPQLHDNINSS